MYGSAAAEITPHTSLFHDLQSITGDTLVLALVVRALQHPTKDTVEAALLAIVIDHGGFALACYRQWGMDYAQPVVMPGALAVTALAFWLLSEKEEENTSSADDDKKDN